VKVPFCHMYTPLTVRCGRLCVFWVFRHALCFFIVQPTKSGVSLPPHSPYDHLKSPPLSHWFNLPLIYFLKTRSFSFPPFVDPLTFSTGPDSNPAFPLSLPFFRPGHAFLTPLKHRYPLLPNCLSPPLLAGGIVTFLQFQVHCFIPRPGILSLVLRRSLFPLNSRPANSCFVFGPLFFTVLLCHES